MGIQCRVLIAEFSKFKMDYAGLGGGLAGGSARHGQFLLCAKCDAGLWGIRRRFPLVLFVVLCDDVVRKLCARAIHSVSVRVCAREKE